MPRADPSLAFDHIVLAGEPPFEAVHFKDIVGLIVGDRGAGTSGAQEVVAVPAMGEVCARAGGAQVGDARLQAVVGGPFGHDGGQGRFVMIEGGAAANENVLTAPAIEDGVAGAADE